MNRKRVDVTSAKLDSRIIMMTAVSKYLFSMSRKVLSRRWAQPCQNGELSSPLSAGIFSYQMGGRQASGYCSSSSSPKPGAMAAGLGTASAAAASGSSTMSSSSLSSS